MKQELQLSELRKDNFATAHTASGVATGGGTGGTRPHLFQGPVLGFVQIRREVVKWGGGGGTTLCHLII